LLIGARQWLPSKDNLYRVFFAETVKNPADKKPFFSAAKVSPGFLILNNQGF